MCEVLLFGGTTEGRLLAEFCAANRIPAVVSVTSHYAAALLPQSRFLRLSAAAMDGAEMQSYLQTHRFRLVVDATHPYARLATENIRAACRAANTAYYRLLRPQDSPSFGTVVPDLNALVAHLNQTGERILCTLGSKALPSLTRVAQYRERLWVRVLPGAAIRAHCIALGFDPGKIISGKGPFSVAENQKHIARSGARLLVTKNSGAAGGYPEKVQAAQLCKISVVTLQRPPETGYSLAAIEQILLGKAGER